MATVKDELKRLATEQAQRAGVRSVTLRDLGRAVGIKVSLGPLPLQEQGHARLRDHPRLRAASSADASEIERRHTGAKKRLTAAVDMFLEVQVKHELCLCTMLAAETHEVDERTQQLLRDFFADLEAWIARALRTDDGHTLTAGQASAQSKLILAALEGAMLLDKAEGEPKWLPALRSTLGRLVG